MKWLRVVLLLSAIAASIVPLARYGAARGPMFDAAREHPGHMPIAVISGDWFGFLFDSYVYPRPAKRYRSVAAYRADPHAPREFVYVTERGLVAPPRFTTATSFLVPLVTASGSYTTEGWLRGRAHVWMELVPQHIVKTLTIDGDVAFVDLVRQNFALEETGWLRVTSDVPLEASFALVNGEQWTPLRIVQGGTHWRVPAGEKLWIVSERGVTSAPAQCPCEVDAIYAFGSRKLPDGNTELSWP
jgi:hypothetical protein